MERAKNNPKDLSGILTKDFNIRDTISNAWLSFDDINNEKTFDLPEFKNCYAIGGADLSITTDLTCATLLLMNKETEERFITQMYWLPRDNFEKRVQLDKIPYEDAVSIKQKLIGHFGKTKYYRFYREERYLTPKEQAYIRQVFCNKGITEAPSFTRYTDEYMW